MRPLIPERKKHARSRVGIEGFYRTIGEALKWGSAAGKTTEPERLSRVE